MGSRYFSHLTKIIMRSKIIMLVSRRNLHMVADQCVTLKNAWQSPLFWRWTVCRVVRPRGTEPYRTLFSLNEHTGWHSWTGKSKWTLTAHQCKAVWYYSSFTSHQSITVWTAQSTCIYLYTQTFRQTRLRTYVGGLALPTIITIQHPQTPTHKEHMHPTQGSHSRVVLGDLFAFALLWPRCWHTRK